MSENTRTGRIGPDDDWYTREDDDSGLGITFGEPKDDRDLEDEDEGPQEAPQTPQEPPTTNPTP